MTAMMAQQALAKQFEHSDDLRSYEATMVKDHLMGR